MIHDDEISVRYNIVTVFNKDDWENCPLRTEESDSSPFGSKHFIPMWMVKLQNLTEQMPIGIPKYNALEIYGIEPLIVSIGTELNHLGLVGDIAPEAFRAAIEAIANAADADDWTYYEWKDMLLIVRYPLEVK